MRFTIKPACSLLTIILFLVFAIASIGPDSSTNTSVSVKSCEARPQFAGTLQVYVTYVDENGGSLVNMNGNIFIAHQTVTNVDDCTYSTETVNHPFQTGADGTYSYTGTEYFHDNTGDLFRVEVNIPQNQYTGCKEVKVQTYNSATFGFVCTGKKLNDL